MLLVVVVVVMVLVTAGHSSARAWAEHSVMLHEGVAAQLLSLGGAYGLFVALLSLLLALCSPV